MPIKVVIIGASGRMGTVGSRCLATDPRFEVVGRVGRVTAEGVETDLESCLDQTKPDVLLELTTGRTAGGHSLMALGKGIRVVIGATGLPDSELKQISGAVEGSAAFLVPNFAVGAVLMMHFAGLAAEWLPDAEIIELHHEKKVDAPSGTAMRTAQIIQESRLSAPLALPNPLLKAEGARGASVNEVPVHSVRLRGMLAHQEVLFGGQGEVLTIRHDSLDRSSFESGICLACEKVMEMNGFVVGLESVMF
ncbi:MAG: 4-hydroxy-tetrahydrodipicolinate reductase [Armatimonadota bacterium]